MKHIYISILCLFFIEFVNAQDSNVSIKGYKNPTDFFNEKLSEFGSTHFFILQDLCVSGCAFVVIKIDKSGSVLSVNVDKNTPVVFKDILVRICNMSKNKWKVPDELKRDTIAVLLPVVYNFFNKTCTPKNRFSNSIQSLMSPFGQTEKGHFDGIERIEETPNVFLLSPASLKGSFY